jgi:hypothetical protein
VSSATQPNSAGASLALFVRAGTWVFAIDAARIERILLTDEIDGAVRGPGGVTQRIQIGTRWYPARSLAELFATKATDSALVLVRIDDELVVALDVGACLKVAPLPRLTTVPAGVVRIRGAGLRGAFATDAMLGDLGGPPVGLAIDLARILTADELSAMRRELREAQVDDWSTP